MLGFCFHGIDDQKVGEFITAEPSVLKPWEESKIIVQIDQPVRKGEPAYLRHSGDPYKLGFLRADDDGGKASKLPNAEWDEDADIEGGKGFAVLLLNPQKNAGNSKPR